MRPETLKNAANRIRTVRGFDRSSDTDKMHAIMEAQAVILEALADMAVPREPVLEGQHITSMPWNFRG